MRAGTRGEDTNVVGEGYWKQRKTRATRPAHLTSPFHRVHTSLLGGGRRSGLGVVPARSALAARRSALKRDTTCQHRAGTSLEWDFDGHVELGVVGLYVPPVLVSELLKDLAELRLVGEKTGARGERLPTGLQADGRGLAHVFVPLGL